MKKQSLMLTAIIGVMMLAGCSNQPRVVQTSPAQQTQPPQQTNYNASQNAPAGSAQMGSGVGGAAQSQPQQVVYKVPKSALKPQLIKITGIGYGAESTYDGYTPGQRRLMAIRAAKLDAYRSLAEQLYGIKIDSNTSIATLTAQNDSFRARVNAIVRGARVVSITPMADHNYETTLEVYIDKSFFENAFVYSDREEEMTISAEDLCQTMNCQTIGGR
ncbi:MAG: LPP20 family lipoprotein [Hydrogenovibrio sp.]